MGRDHRATEGSHLQVFYEAVLEVAGREGWLMVLRARGGQEVYVQMAPPEGNWLSVLLGCQSARRIGNLISSHDADGRQIGDYKFTLPVGDLGAMNVLRSQADRLLTEGATVRDVAATLSIHERTVWRRRAALVAAGKLKKGRSP